jgi:hypothetical protein
MTCTDPHCENLSLPTDAATVADVETGARYCDALCHHSHHYGVRPPITPGEEIALDRAWAWMRKHRPIDPRTLRHFGA